MSETPVTPEVPVAPAVVAAPAPAQPAAAKKPLNALQICEQQIKVFFQQKEQAIANVHAIEGAIQAAQHLVGKLKAEAAKVETVVDAAVKAVKAEAEKVENKVISIADAVKKEL